ncbi:hypothetical protein [Gynuella sp.]|uniref:hypothetical protein n=1 Tax=Gynuella sp. TaxID=2969146 RepID=UPI003D0BDD9C
MANISVELDGTLEDGKCFFVIESQKIGSDAYTYNAKSVLLDLASFFKRLVTVSDSLMKTDALAIIKTIDDMENSGLSVDLVDEVSLLRDRMICFNGSYMLDPYLLISFQNREQERVIVKGDNWIVDGYFHQHKTVEEINRCLACESSGRWSK